MQMREADKYARILAGALCYFRDMLFGTHCNDTEQGNPVQLCILGEKATGQAASDLASF
jgi:hypothetical protein